MQYIRSFISPRVVRALRAPAVAAVALLGACAASDAFANEVSTAVSNLAGMRLFVSSDSPARRQADDWRTSRPQDAALMDRIASQPVARWLGDWNTDIRGDVSRFVAAAAGATPLFVAYNIPNRDCGSYSAGGSSTGDAYRQWISNFAAGLGGTKSIVVLEPDAVAGASCLSAADRDQRFALLRDAVQRLKSANAMVYIDAGHPGWLSASAAAERLAQAGIGLADGFSLNVSNYVPTSANLAYGDEISRLVGNKHYIVDTSRNGIGAPDGQWCNVPGQALGAVPTTVTGHPLADAFFWIKVPGESDGPCNGGPRAGAWWADYALGLAERSMMVASR